MPGSYPDPNSFANEAIQILEEAYNETPETYAGSLILKAINAISLLKVEIRELSQQGLSSIDPYEIDESNSAI